MKKNIVFLVLFAFISFFPCNSVLANKYYGESYSHIDKEFDIYLLSIDYSVVNFSSLKNKYLGHLIVSNNSCSYLPECLSAMPVQCSYNQLNLIGLDVSLNNIENKVYIQYGDFDKNGKLLIGTSYYSLSKKSNTTYVPLDIININNKIVQSFVIKIVQLPNN